MDVWERVVGSLWSNGLCLSYENELLLLFLFLLIYFGNLIMVLTHKSADFITLHSEFRDMVRDSSFIFKNYHMP